MSLGERETAEWMLRSAHELSYVPPAVVAHCGGLLQRDPQLLAQAAEVYQSLLQSFPDTPLACPALLGGAYSFEKSGQPAKALPHFEKGEGYRHLNFQMMYDNEGNYFPVNFIMSKVRVEKVEVHHDGKMFDVPVALAD